MDRFVIRRPRPRPSSGDVSDEDPSVSKQLLANFFVVTYKQHKKKVIFLLLFFLGGGPPPTVDETLV